MAIPHKKSSKVLWASTVVGTSYASSYGYTILATTRKASGKVPGKRALLRSGEERRVEEDETDR
tara:strand:- start:1422 stop:1613 length:192 start_codon:yes stop_codon:yes gene_type:complete